MEALTADGMQAITKISSAFKLRWQTRLIQSHSSMPWLELSHLPMKRQFVHIYKLTRNMQI